VVAGRRRGQRRRPGRAAKRLGGGAARRRAGDPVDLSARREDGAAVVAGARRVRAVRRIDRARVPGDHRLRDRKRAEPQPLLDAAVRRQRRRPRRAVVRAAARDRLRRAQVGVAGCERDRRRALPGGAGQGRVDPTDAFADGVHQRSRRRLPRDASPPGDHGHVRDPPVLDPVAAAADLRASADDDDRDRRLPQARAAAHLRVRRNGPARRNAADRLRRVRLPDADPRAEALRVLEPRCPGGEGRDPGSRAGGVLPAGARARRVPADGRGPAHLPRRRRAGRARVAVGPVLREQLTEDEPAGGAARRARSTGRNARRLHQAEDDDQPGRGHLPRAGRHTGVHDIAVHDPARHAGARLLLHHRLQLRRAGDRRRDR
jgi:hypothetical protein